jgi:hypothetical protein
MPDPSYDGWFDRLEDDEKRRTERLLEQFKGYDADEPEEWTRSEIEENIAQLARFLFLRRVLKGHVNQWQESPELWINACQGKPEHNLYAPFPDVGPALTKMLGAGISPGEIGAVARMVAYATAWDIVHQIDSGRDPEAEDNTPGWVLMETTPEREQTGRDIGGLHEDMLVAMEDILRSESPAE